MFRVSANDSDLPPQTVLLSASGLPSGSSFDTATGSFTWTPSEAQGPGDYTVVFTADDGHGGVVTSSTNTHVDEVNSPPILNLPNPQTATPGVQLRFTVSATDPDIPANSITLSASGLAPGMSFDSSTGSFTFTPLASQAGQSFTVIFSASDHGVPPLTTTRTYDVPVASPIEPPGSGRVNCGLVSPTTSIWWLVAGRPAGRPDFRRSRTKTR